MTETGGRGIGSIRLGADAAPGVLSMARAALADAFAVLAPVRCVVCERDETMLCAACAAGLRSGCVQRDAVAGIPLSSRTRYEGAARAALLAYKEQGRTPLARPLGPLLGEAVADALAVAGAGGAARIEFVTVPSEPRAFRLRGFRPVPLLLERAHLPPPAEVLARARRRRDQADLDREARAGNLAGALVARRRLDGRRFVVVEDVVTTGATLAETVRAVSAAGGSVVAAAALARTPKRV
jgi:predicted amidophosphoribosyltransferase